MSSQGTYARRSSGLVRQASLTDLLIMGFTGATVFYVNYFLVPIYKALLPGANLALSCAFAAIFAIPAYFIYAGLGTAMPRAGGDYLYQSRGLLPPIGFAVVVGFWVIGAGAFLATALLATLDLSGIYPVLLFGGYSSVATFISSPNGLVIMGFAVLILAVANAAAGIRWIARIQKYVILPAFIISGITIPLILFSSNPAAFHTSFNNYASSLFGSSGLYEQVMKGFTTTNFDWFQTIILGMVLGDTLVMFSVASAPLLGEIKGANNFKGVWWAYFLGGTITAVVFMLPESLALQNALGEGFLQAISQAGLFGTPALPVAINFAILTDFATSSYALIVLSSLAYIAVGYFIVAYDITWVSRIWLATSVDGLTPRALGSTDRRTHAPLIAIILAAVAIAIYIPIEAYIPSGFTIVGNVGIWTSAATPLITAVAAIAFPSTQKSIFKVSPISRYGPLLRVMGILLAALLVIVMVSFVIYPPLEVALGVVGYSLLAAQFIGVLIWYFVFKAYQKRQGVDISLAFKEIPAE